MPRFWIVAQSGAPSSMTASAHRSHSSVRWRIILASALPRHNGCTRQSRATAWFQNVDLLVPILGQLGYGVDQRVLDSFNLLLRLYGGSLRPSTLLRLRYTVLGLRYTVGSTDGYR
jgi:hypothetical protein